MTDYYSPSSTNLEVDGTLDECGLVQMREQVEKFMKVTLDLSGLFVQGFDKDLVTLCVVTLMSIMFIHRTNGHFDDQYFKEAEQELEKIAGNLGV